MIMFRFEAIKPEIQEVIQEKKVSKESLRLIFFHSLLELERLRNHRLNLESEINDEKDLFLLLNLGERREYTSQSIATRRKLTRRLLPMILKQILEAYLHYDEIDRWDRLILFNEEAIEEYLSGEITYEQLLKKTIFRCDQGDA